LVSDFGLFGSHADFLVQFAAEGTFQSFAGIYAALGKLPGAAFAESFADEDPAMGITENAGDVESVARLGGWRHENGGR
jgi:hypothetical protein